MAILPLYIPTLRPIAIPGAGEHPVNCIYTRRNPIWLAGKSPIWFEKFPVDSMLFDDGGKASKNIDSPLPSQHRFKGKYTGTPYSNGNKYYTWLYTL